MKILVLNYEFPPVGGGGGRATSELCAALASRGHELRVVTSRATGLSRRELVDGYEVVRVPSGRRSRFRASFAVMGGFVLGALMPAVRLIRSWKPDLIHAHFAVPTGVVALWLAKLTRLPYVLTAHLGDVPGGVPEKTDRWFRYVYPFTPSIWSNAAKVVAVSEHTKSLAQKRYEVEIEVIPNGLRLPDEHPKAVADPPRLIFAGRFQPQKNLPVLIELLARARDLPWECELIGDGPDRQRLVDQVRHHELDSRVRFRGWVDSETVEERLKASDLLVMPSRSEGLPVIGVQALALGVAVLASRVGGLAELVDDKDNGRLCAVDDLDCFEEALRWCLGDPQRLLGLKRASRRIAARYDIQAVADKYERLFDEVLTSGV